MVVPLTEIRKSMGESLFSLPGDIKCSFEHAKFE